MGILYLLDANFFIQAHRTYYPLDIAVGFWEKVKELAHAGKLASIDKVKAEIYKNDDALKKWCIENLPSNFFKDSAPILSEYGKVIAWAASKSSHYTTAALAEFSEAAEADPWLVAFALANTCIVVTEETSQPESKKRIKLPDVCLHFQVKYVTSMGLFRELKEKF